MGIKTALRIPSAFAVALAILAYSHASAAAPKQVIGDVPITDFLADCSRDGTGSSLNCATCKYKHPVLRGLLTAGEDYEDLTMCTAKGERTQCLIISRRWNDALSNQYKARCKDGCDVRMRGDYNCGAYNSFSPDFIMLTEDPAFHLGLGKELLEKDFLQEAKTQFDIVELAFRGNALAPEAHQLGIRVRERIAGIQAKLAADESKKNAKAESTRNRTITMNEIREECGGRFSFYDSDKCPWNDRQISVTGNLRRAHPGLVLCSDPASACLKVEVPRKTSMEWERRCEDGCQVEIKGRLFQKITYTDKRTGIELKEEAATLAGLDIHEIAK